MTLREIESMGADFLTVAEVASCLGSSPQLIRDEASKDPKYLGFPITKIGHSYKIPREGFLAWARGQIPVFQLISSNEAFKSFERMGLAEGSDAD